jgi:hypothetical protein
MRLRVSFILKLKTLNFFLKFDFSSKLFLANWLSANPVKASRAIAGASGHLGRLVMALVVAENEHENRKISATRELSPKLKRKNAKKFVNAQF